MTRHRKDRAELIVETIADFHAEYGYGPTVRELGERVGLSTPSAVHHHLVKLHREGRITWDQGLSRTLSVVVPEVPEPPDPVALTSLALHRWRHPTFKGWGRCRCQEDAQEALLLLASWDNTGVGSSDESNRIATVARVSATTRDAGDVASIEVVAR